MWHRSIENAAPVFLRNIARPDCVEDLTACAACCEVDIDCGEMYPFALIIRKREPCPRLTLSCQANMLS